MARRSKQPFSHLDYFMICLAIVVIFGLISTVAGWLGPVQ